MENGQNNILIFGLIVLAVAISECEAITCYECNSFTNRLCDDPFSSNSSLVDCATKSIPEWLLKYKRATMCRKTWQRISGKVRITRSCGYISNKNFNDQCVLQKSNTFRQMSCACNTNQCNAATTNQLRLGQFMVLYSALVATLRIL